LKFGGETNNGAMVLSEGIDSKTELWSTSNIVAWVKLRLGTTWGWELLIPKGD
jgi:hypothetical protein